MNDGPSRNLAPASPLLQLPSCFASLPELAELAEFDTWLHQAGADPYTVSGLPDFLELMPEPPFPSRPMRGSERKARRDILCGRNVVQSRAIASTVSLPTRGADPRTREESFSSGTPEPKKSHKNRGGPVKKDQKEAVRPRVGTSGPKSFQKRRIQKRPRAHSPACPSPQ